MDTILQDVRYAMRQLLRQRGFTLAALLTLALGIGATTALFSVVNAVLLRPLPYLAPAQLYSIWTAPVGSPEDRNPASYPDFKDWQRDNTVFDGMAAYAFNRYELSGPEGLEMSRAAIGSPELFGVLGTRPVLGRVPRPDEDNVAVVAISHRLWFSRYGGAPSVIGQTIRLNGNPFQIVGVMPPGFHFPTPDIDLWTTLQPMHANASNAVLGDWFTSRAMHGWRVVARLKPGVTEATAGTMMNALQARMGKADPEGDGGLLIRTQSIREQTVGKVERSMWLMLGAAGLLLLLACANVAHLQLARAATRSREVAVRRALGADRARVIRQLLTESVLLGLIGGLLGVLVATWGTALLLRFGPSDLPRLETIGLDAPVLAFAVGVSILTGLLFGSVPAFFAWRGGMLGALREGGRGVSGQRRGSAFRAGLMTTEIALALMLLVGAGLMTRSFARLIGTDPGFDGENVLTFHLDLSLARTPDAVQQATATTNLLAAIRAVPGVLSAGSSTSMPPSFIQRGGGFDVEGDPASPPGKGPSALYVPATPGYLATLRVPVVEGRDILESDDSKAAAVILVNRELVHRYLGTRPALGHRLMVDGVLRTIVGVVGNVTYDGLGAPVGPQIFMPFSQAPFPGQWVVVRTAGTPQSVITGVSAAIRGVDSELRPRNPRPMSEVLAASVLRPRFQTWLFAAFGVLALILATLGIYGVVAYGVSQRTSEIGLRLALGAQTGTVRLQVVRDGMAPVALGLVVGLVGSLLLSKLLGSLLYGIAPTDAMTFGGVTALLGTVALVAAYVPARRASRVDPAVALRGE